MATYFPYSDVIAAYGYRQTPQPQKRNTVLVLAFAYVVIGGALGTVAGTGLAMASLHSGIPTVVFQVTPPVEASITTNAVATAPAQLPELAAQPVAAPVSYPTASPLKLVVVTAVATHHRSAVAHRSVLRAAVVRPVASPVPVSVFPVAAVAAPSAPAVAAVAKTLTFFNEGDATVADFNVSAGTVETYEGKTFVLSTTATASVAQLLGDSGISVHYRCDQSGNCTLMRAGMSMQTARLM